MIKLNEIKNNPTIDEPDITCPYCHSHAIRDLGTGKVECAECHKTFEPSNIKEEFELPNGFYPYVTGICLGRFRIWMWEKKLPKSEAISLAKSFEDAIKQHNPNDIAKESMEKYIEELRNYAEGK